MPNPPYSGCVIVLRESTNGIHARVFTWEEFIAVTKAAADSANQQAGKIVQVVGGEVPPSPAGFINTLTAAGSDRYFENLCATRTSLQNQLGLLWPSLFPDTPA